MQIYKVVAGQGEEIMLIHGALVDHRHIQPVADMLSPCYRVTSIDLPGNGQSPWQDSIKTLDDLVDAILPELPSSAIYIGWSLGGMVAMNIAARFPAKVKRLIGIATTPRFVEDQNWPGVTASTFTTEVYSDLKAQSASAYFCNVCDVEFARFPVKPKEYFQLRQLWEQAGEMSWGMIGASLEMLTNTDLRAVVKSLRCPIDFILGEQDALVPIAGKSAMTQLNPNLKVHVIPGAMHLPFLD